MAIHVYTVSWAPGNAFPRPIHTNTKPARPQVCTVLQAQRGHRSGTCIHAQRQNPPRFPLLQEWGSRVAAANHALPSPSIPEAEPSYYSLLFAGCRCLTTLIRPKQGMRRQLYCWDVHGLYLRSGTQQFPHRSVNVGLATACLGPSHGPFQAHNSQTALRCISWSNQLTASAMQTQNPLTAQSGAVMQIENSKGTSLSTERLPASKRLCLLPPITPHHQLPYNLLYPVSPLNCITSVSAAPVGRSPPGQRLLSPARTSCD